MQLIDNGLSALPENAGFDVVVIGAGGAGMAAALYAAIDGASVLLVERSEFVGGTTAWSGGTTWIPGTRHGAAVNPADTLQDAKRYLDNAVGERTPAALRQAFLDNGPRAVDQIEANSEVKYRAYPRHPDYISDLKGSTVNGRALEPLPFDGRLLGDLFRLIRPPIPEFTVLGGMMVDRTDINHLLALSKSFASFRHAVKLLARHAGDRLRHPRGTRLVMGNALVGRLLYSLSLRKNVTLAMNTSVENIHQDAGGVKSVTLVNKGQRRSVQVRGGVILASGGFNRHPGLRQQMLPGVDAAWCPAAPGHTGQAHELAHKLGGHYASGGLSPAFWAPVSTRQREDGSQAVFPHFMMDRAKPGMITVNQAGERFVNESTSYHLFGLKMQEASKTTPAIPAYLICDAEALRRYGLGMVRPGGKGLAPYLADGYLTQADSLEELAKKLGINAAGLKSSVHKLNAYAATGIDPDFQRGVTAYSQNMGDASRGGKNPNLGALSQAPYYAVRLYPGDIGAATGFETDTDARVLGANRQPVGGLYAVGNDMHSIMGGTYPAPGITLGPGLVFAYLAARHALARARQPVAA
ncbi:FAD-dependent oxidoreductase [Polaromonas naphthalenivorans]|uniref:Fumarate reductase/succinate dehydrogenase flavoprotein domain protein n=1 Tax=Polaromonas naphthalenivorans (strain CJ2) TaxID=365044 RepID=A1VQT1_POLNA|nr:FAD-dependent oxidoreductase [Polaromonas naphthalenivorans]ABM38009.1 fumarate reductase/succinate dehydrogenase flavoprotein domain protein [Polaromonas naphthalenivorans CJ2]